MNPFAMGLLGDLFSAGTGSSASRSNNTTTEVKVPWPGKPGADINLVKVVVNLSWR